MNILCEFEIPFKGEVKKCKLTMKALLETQHALGLSGLRDLGEKLEALDLSTSYVLISKCLGEGEVIDLYEEDIPVVLLTMELLAGILSLFEQPKKAKPSKKK
jgi:hypothetical protein